MHRLCENQETIPNHMTDSINGVICLRLILFCLFRSYFFFGWFVCGFGCLYLHSNGTFQYCWCLHFYDQSLFAWMCVVAWCGESRKSSLKNGLFMKTTQLQGKTVLSYVWFDSLVSCMKNWFWSCHNSRLKCLHFWKSIHKINALCIFAGWIYVLHLDKRWTATFLLIYDKSHIFHR